MQPKSKFFFIVLLILCLDLSGCAPGRPQQPPPPPHAGAVVRVACPRADLVQLIDRHSRAWKARQQAKRVEVVQYDPVQGPEQVGPADVWLLPASELSRWVAAGRLLPVPEPLTSADSSLGWTGLLPLYRDRLLIWDQVKYALPVIGDSPVCCYRSDLLQERNLKPPLTWQDFEELAGKLHKPDRPSLPPLPADDEELDREFSAIAAAYACRAVLEHEQIAANQRDEVFSFHYDLATGKPRIDSPGFVHALQLLQRLQKYRPMGTGSPVKAFAQGQAALCLSETWAVARYQLGKGSKVRDRFSVCRMPGGEGYFGTRGRMQPLPQGVVNFMPYLGTGAWLGVVPRDAASPDAAFDLLGDLASRVTSDQIVLDVSPGSRSAGGVIRQEQLEERCRWDAFDLDQARTTALKESLRHTLLHRGLKNPVLCLRTPTSREHRRLLMQGVREAVTEGKDANAQEMLSKVADAWSQLDQHRGVEKVKAEYRISVGLLAK